MSRLHCLAAFRTLPHEARLLFQVSPEVPAPSVEPKRDSGPPEPGAGAEARERAADEASMRQRIAIEHRLFTEAKMGMTDAQGTQFEDAVARIQNPELKHGIASSLRRNNPDGRLALVQLAAKLSTNRAEVINFLREVAQIPDSTGTMRERLAPEDRVAVERVEATLSPAERALLTQLPDLMTDKQKAARAEVEKRAAAVSMEDPDMKRLAQTPPDSLIAPHEALHQLRDGQNRILQSPGDTHAKWLQYRKLDAPCAAVEKEISRREEMVARINAELEKTPKQLSRVGYVGDEVSFTLASGTRLARSGPPWNVTVFGSRLMPEPPPALWQGDELLHLARALNEPPPPDPSIDTFQDGISDTPSLEEATRDTLTRIQAEEKRLEGAMTEHRAVRDQQNMTPEYELLRGQRELQRMEREGSDDGNARSTLQSRIAEEQERARELAELRTRLDVLWKKIQEIHAQQQTVLMRMEQTQPDLNVQVVLRGKQRIPFAEATPEEQEHALKDRRDAVRLPDEAAYVRLTEQRKQLREEYDRLMARMHQLWPGLAPAEERALERKRNDAWNTVTEHADNVDHLRKQRQNLFREGVRRDWMTRRVSEALLGPDRQDPARASAERRRIHGVVRYPDDTLHITLRTGVQPKPVIQAIASINPAIQCETTADGNLILRKLPAELWRGDADLRKFLEAVHRPSDTAA